jgi:hypothetical protein
MSSPTMRFFRIAGADPSGPTNSGKAALLAAANTSPSRFTSRASAAPPRRASFGASACFQRAAATCSSMASSRPSGQRRRTSALRTQGSFSKAARTASRLTVRKLPATALRAAYSICVGVTSRSAPPTTTSRSGKNGRRATASVAA